MVSIRFAAMTYAMLFAAQLILVTFGTTTQISHGYQDSATDYASLLDNEAGIEFITGSLLHETSSKWLSKTVSREQTLVFFDASTSSENKRENIYRFDATEVSWEWIPVNWNLSLYVQLGFAIAGIVGNFLVMAVLFKRRAKSRSTDTLIGGLAGADFLTSIFIIPVPVASSVPTSFLGELYCRLISTGTFLWTSISASTYLLMSISVERYIAVVYPLYFNRHFNRRRVSMFIILVWVVSFVSVLFGVIVKSVDEASHTCILDYHYKTGQVIIAYYWFSLKMVIPCLTMVITQILIARELGKQASLLGHVSRTGGVARGTPSFHIVARERVIKMMFIVIAIYIVCWSPNQIAYLGFNLGWVPVSFNHSSLQKVLVLLGFLNSCANPIIYTARFPEFRTAVKEMMTCSAGKNTPLFEKNDLKSSETMSTQSFPNDV
ncbi:trace amine-associated receptor 7e-like [Diadema antillarum]|uniref:trace amine-associated receptor 7e-like n=1 Tax=Diadema antillarum TaxID=105358 RepID=UPI003A8B7EE6